MQPAQPQTGLWVLTLDDDDLPQVSDAVLVMVQFKSALASFKERHYRHVSRMGYQWITEELIDQLKAEYEEDPDAAEDEAL